jgi:hypothetical protein
MPRNAPYGFTRYVDRIQVPFTGFLTVVAVNLQLSKTYGFRQALEKIEMLTTVVGTGAGATRLFNIRKGSATGTIIGTFTPTLANQGTLGVVTAGVLSAVTGSYEGASNFLGDTDTLTIEAPNAGTTFTAGGFDLLLTFRQLSQRPA